MPFHINKEFFVLKKLFQAPHVTCNNFLCGKWINSSFKEVAFETI